MAKQDPLKLEETLTRRVDKILPSKEGLKDLLKKKKIKIYFGVDPTSSKLHLGHALVLKKLKEFSDLGQEITLLIGNFTAQIGDPEGKKEARKPQNQKEIEENLATYKEQASKILDFSKIKIAYNADWLSKLNLEDVIKLASYFTVQQIIEREMFQVRLQQKTPIWLHEFLYPLLQGYDSVKLNVDLEIGGTDQTFNMLCGRTLQKIYNKKEKYVLTVPLLEGLDGRKMSKSLGNTVNLTDKPNDMFGKIMSLKDELIVRYFELCTELPLEDIKKFDEQLKSGEINPRDLKARLAKEIVTIYHNKEAAEEAEQEFNKIFREKEMPTEIQEMKIKEKNLNILDLLVMTKMASSKSEAKRLVVQKGVKIDGVLKEDWQELLEIKKGMVIQAGKRRFLKLS